MARRVGKTTPAEVPRRKSFPGKTKKKKPGRTLRQDKESAVLSKGKAEYQLAMGNSGEKGYKKEKH